MAQLLIRNLKTETVNRIKERAKQHNRSLQGEVKYLLEESIKEEVDVGNPSFQWAGALKKLKASTPQLSFSMKPLT